MAELGKDAVFEPEDVVSVYTTAMAEEDGLLVRNQWVGNRISHITLGVWNQYAEKIGALEASPVINVTKLVEVLRKADRAIEHVLERNPKEWLVTGIKVGDEELWAALNDQGRWTLMSPEEY